MYFSLRTENETQKEQVAKVIDLLKTTFGENNITTRDYEMFITVETKGVSGLLDFTATHSMSLFTGVSESDKKMKIDIDLFDTVYDLER